MICDDLHVFNVQAAQKCGGENMCNHHELIAPFPDTFVQKQQSSSKLISHNYVQFVKNQVGDDLVMI